MASIISKVTELDKEMRIKVKKLEDEKTKLPIFLKKKSKELSKQYEEQEKKQIAKIKLKNDKILEKTKSIFKKDLNKSIIEIQEIYNEKKEEWIESIYLECIKDFTGE